MSKKKVFEIEIDNLIKSCYENIHLINKEKYNQYYTPITIADYMASMFNNRLESINILDPGCGLGILTMAVVKYLLKSSKTKKICVSMYEIDEIVIPHLQNNMEELKNICTKNKVELVYTIKNEDFIFSSTSLLKENNHNDYDYVVMNPPYNKMSNDSEHKKALKSIGIDISNYYSAFVQLSCEMLKNKGQLVAITPRSFCNGKYFDKFRDLFLKKMYFKKIHLFESRKDVFDNEDILQESMIYYCIKDKAKKNTMVKVCHSYNSKLDNTISTNILLRDIIVGDNKVIRLSKGKKEDEIIKCMMRVRCSLQDIGLNVSTGPVVDFRENQNVLHENYIDGDQVILFPEHINNRAINWPIIEGLKKFNYISINQNNINRLRINGNYVVIKRMTSKEEKRRIVSALYVGKFYDFDLVGFDNKLNYFHINKQGIDIDIAKGLNIYLNSTLVDSYFRTFSGNTQVNVSDLKMIRYPDTEQLRLLGTMYENELPSQETIDKLVKDVIL